MPKIHMYADDMPLDTFFRYPNGTEHIASVEFQTGFPYIGLPIETYKDVRNMLHRSVP